MEAVSEKIYEYLATYGLQILAAVLIFFIGRWVSKIISKLIGKALLRAKIEPTLSVFVENLSYIGLLVFVIIAALSKLGIQTAQFIAVIGAAGLAIGLALQGSLSNFASGVLLMTFKPFKVGDFVELAGTKGTVEAVHIFNTVLNSLDNVRIVIPNAQVTGSVISNYTVNDSRRVDMVFGISYDDDISKAKKLIEDVIAADKRVLKDPAPVVAVLELGNSSVNLAVRPWVKTNDYWDVYFDFNEKVKLALETAGMTMPFPQQDIYIKSVPASGLK